MTSSETHFSKAFAATDLCRDIETLFPELVTIRHTLHQHPEKGTQEFETDRIITGCLDAWGIPYRMIADTVPDWRHHLKVPSGKRYRRSPGKAAL